MFVIDRDVAEALASLRAPRRRDDRRANQYGGKGIIKFNPTQEETLLGIREEITLIDWQSEDGMPHTVTIDLGRIFGAGVGTFPQGSIPTDVAVVGLSYRAQAQVILGTPSAMSDPFFVDINRGQRFTASASYVAVTARMLTPSVLGVNRSGSLGVFGNLGYGPAVSTAPVLITQYFDVLTVGVPVLSTIPPRANVLVAVSGDTAGNTTQIDLVDNAGASFTFTVVGGYVSNAMNVLPADAFSLRITNLGPLEESVNLVYQVSV